MKKRVIQMLMVIALSVSLAACGGGNDEGGNAGNGTQSANTGQNEGSNAGNDQDAGTDAGNAGGDQSSGDADLSTTGGIVDKLLSASEQPAYMDLEEAMIQDTYHFDPALLEEFTIKTPMMNISTNEIAVLKVKDAKDIAAVEEGIKQRAADVQKTFENYLPNQYENAKNYKLVAKGNFVLFVISEEAEQIAKQFDELIQ